MRQARSRIDRLGRRLTRTDGAAIDARETFFVAERLASVERPTVRKE
jgi:hypothetical protein